MSSIISLLLSLLGTFSVSTNAQSLFHGTSIVLYPNATSAWPGDSTFVAANFYCYFTPTGYLSFGWWLPATTAANHSHCIPRPSAFDWYEYTTSSSCDEHGCRTHAINFLTSNPEEPYFEEDYVLAALDLGNGQLGELGLSYFDKPGGAYAVGTRRTLNGNDADPQMIIDCHDAFQTLKGIKETWKLDLPFELKDECEVQGRRPNQKVLGWRQ